MAVANLPSLVQQEFMRLLNGGAIPVRGLSGLRVILDATIRDGRLPDIPHLDFLLERDGINRIDKIDALEMAGAVILGQDENHANFPLAFQYWRRALTLRLMDTEDCRPICKTPTKSKSEQLSEWSTLDDLQRIEQQPAQRKVQSLLVRLRILSGIGWNAVDQHFLEHINDFLFAGPHDAMGETLDLTWITLDTILRLELDLPRGNELMRAIIDIISLLNIAIERLLEDKPNFNSENLMAYVDLVLMTDSLHLIDPKLDVPATLTGHMLNLYRMFRLLSRFPAQWITGEARISLLQLVHRDDRDEEGYSLLHYACFFFVSSSKALSTIRFLVKLGADLNAVTNAGDEVLHLLSLYSASKPRDATAHLLVELGAHLDMANKEGMTAADLWFQANTPGKKDVADLPDWLQEGVPNLQCLSSRVIRRHKLPYEDGEILPAVLIPFVTLH